MQGNHFDLTYHLHGTLAANATIRWQAPANCHIEHAQAVASNDSDATIKIGTSADDDGFLTATTIGDSGTPAEYELADFDGALLTEPGKDYPQLSDGDVLLITLDFDGAGGTAAQNVSIAIRLSEG